MEGIVVAAAGVLEAQARMAAESPALMTAGTTDADITTGRGQCLGARNRAIALARPPQGGMILDEETKKRVRSAASAAAIIKSVLRWATPEISLLVPARASGRSRHL